MERAKTLFRTGQFDQALEAADRAIAHNPKSAEAYYYRGIINHTLKRYDRAIADLNEAISLESDLPAYYIARGQLYANQGKNELAIADFDEAIKRDPGNQQAIINRDFCKAEVERLKKVALAKEQEKLKPPAPLAVPVAVSGSSRSSSES
ncbi:MAG TPA: tetratricopeptide repeat protein, partial [Candidatus Obscuribacterales bacterium]